jgi:branched-chain amino acid transport system permease protein
VLAGLLLLTLLPLQTSELTIYRVGLVLIFVIGSIGLHILVNWAGELSLAHAGMVGVPAFVVAILSAHNHVSPLLLLPVGLVTGAAVGGLVALPALRAKGLQVALVTLAAGIAINSFFFTKSWLVGPPGGSRAEVPRLGPFTFRTSRSLYPLLVAVVVVTVAATWALYRSKVARALYWVKINPDAAAVFGIPVRAYRLLAYTIAGAFAGLAGGLTVAWVQRLDSQAFPTTLSFTYLTVVVVAGNGFVGGVAMVAAGLEGGTLFFSTAAAWLAYLGPIGLVLTLTTNKQGVNGQGRQILKRLRDFDKPWVRARRFSPTADIEPAGLVVPRALDGEKVDPVVGR